MACRISFVGSKLSQLQSKGLSPKKIIFKSYKLVLPQDYAKTQNKDVPNIIRQYIWNNIYNIVNYLLSGLKVSIFDNKSRAKGLALGKSVENYYFDLFGSDLIYFKAFSLPIYALFIFKNILPYHLVLAYLRPQLFVAPNPNSPRLIIYKYMFYLGKEGFFLIIQPICNL